MYKVYIITCTFIFHKSDSEVLKINNETSLFMCAYHAHAKVLMQRNIASLFIVCLHNGPL